MAIEITIAGAGLIGSAIAWRLAQSGARVTLIDAGKLGGETSSAGAGMLAPGGEFEEPSRWLEMGRESMRLYPQFVDELKAETGLPIDFQLCGCKHFCPPESAQRRAAFQRTKGIRVEITADGLYYPDDGLVDPTQVLRALRTACQARGVSILENHPLKSLEAADYGALVIAAGAWSDQIHVTQRGRPLQLPAVKPIKGHLIGFDLPPGSLGPMRRRGHDYVLQRANGFTIAGSTEEDAGFDRTVDSETCAGIQRRVTELFPVLGPATPSRAWIGFRPYSPEGPHIGRIDAPNVWLAYGHYRNGILLAPWTAQTVTSQICHSGTI